MTEPLDPNEPRRYEPPAYEPPAYAPPPVTTPPPSYPPAGYQSGGYQPGGYQPGGYPPAPYPGGPAPYPGAQPVGWAGPDGTWTPQPPTPDKRRRTVLIVVAVAIVLVAAGVGAFFLLRSDDNGSSAKGAKPPAAFAGYTLLDNAAATRVKKTMIDVGHNMGGAAGRIFDQAAIGVYSHDTGDQPVMITVTVPSSVAGSGETPDTITRALLSGASSSNEPFPAGGHGGSVRCGEAQFGAVSETMCAWSDNSRSGMLLSVGESLQPADLARVTQQFRDVVE